MDKKDGEIYGTELSPKERFGTKLDGFELVLQGDVVAHCVAKHTSVFTQVSNLCNAMAIVASRC